MYIKSLLVGLLFGVSASTSASVITVDFTGATVTDLSTTAYVENGFEFTASTSDVQAGAAPFNGFGTNSLVDGFFDSGGTVFIQQTSGGLFSLQSFTMDPFSTASDFFDVLGFVGGSQVINFGNFQSPASASPAVFNGFASTPIDELRLVTTALGAASTRYSQFVFDTHAVPVPATLALLGLGLAGIGYSRKRFSQVERV